MKRPLVWTLLACLLSAAGCATKQAYPADSSSHIRQVAVMPLKVFARRCPAGPALRESLVRRLHSLDYEVLSSKEADRRLAGLGDGWSMSPSSAAAKLAVDGVIYATIDACQARHLVLVKERSLAVRLAFFASGSDEPVWTNGAGLKSVERVGATVAGDMMADTALDQDQRYRRRGARLRVA